MDASATVPQVDDATKRAHAATFVLALALLAFFLVSVFFVWRSFHGMRIGGSALERTQTETEVVKTAVGD